MVKSIIALVSFLLIICAQAQSMNATFMLADSSEKTLLPGDIFKGKIQILPHDGVNLERYQGMVGKDFIEYFYTISLDKVALNENNTDVLEIFGTFIAKGPFQKQSLRIWTNGSENLPISIKGISVMSEGQVDPKKDQYIIVEQPYYSAFELNWILLAIFVSLIAVGGGGAVVVIKKKREKRKHAAQKLELIEEWNMRFSACSDRNRYERIYQSRNEWLALLGETPPAVTLFFESLEKCQYKKEWSDLNLSEVNSSFDQIRGVFGQKYGI